MAYYMNWFDAINRNDINLFMHIVANKQIADTYLQTTDGQEYTPALYLARISPYGSKQMLSHLLALDADLSLLARTEDCKIRRRCTTIGNLASWNWQEGLNFKTNIMYNCLVDLNEGHYYDPQNPWANQNAIRWEKQWKLCITTGLGGRWKPGCGIPGISFVSSARRGVRDVGIGIARIPHEISKSTQQFARSTGSVVRGVGHIGLGVGLLGFGIAKGVGRLLTSPFFLTMLILGLHGGKTRKSKRRVNTTRKHRV